MNILVMLGHDRATAGTLVLIDKDIRILGAPCLSKADNQKAASMGNPSRDPRRPYGDTPAGRYVIPVPITWAFDRHTTLGEAWIPLVLEGAIGEQVECAKRNNRSGLLIHAGRGSGTLVPTYGCLRMLARDFFHLCSSIGANEVTVTIEEMRDG